MYEAIGHHFSFNEVIHFIKAHFLYYVNKRMTLKEGSI